MLLSELREAIEHGKTAKLFSPKTHEYGIDLTIRVVKKGSQFLWQRGRIDEPLVDLNLAATTKTFETWEALIEQLRSTMQLRDTTWEESEEPIESEEQPIEKGSLNLV